MIKQHTQIQQELIAGYIKNAKRDKKIAQEWDVTLGDGIY